MKTLDERFVDDPCDDEETIRALVRGDAGGMNINDWVDRRHGFWPPNVYATKCSYLHVACYRCRLELVSLQVEAGADVNKPDSDGNTALHYACAREDDRLSTIEYRNWFKASFNSPGQKKFTSVIIGVKSNLLEVGAVILCWPRATKEKMKPKLISMEKALILF